MIAGIETRLTLTLRCRQVSHFPVCVMTITGSRMRGVVLEPRGCLNTFEDGRQNAMRGGLITGRGCLTLSSNAESLRIGHIQPIPGTVN